jgi:hypothetical protein
MREHQLSRVISALNVVKRFAAENPPGHAVAGLPGKESRQQHAQAGTALRTMPRRTQCVPSVA